MKRKHKNNIFRLQFIDSSKFMRSSLLNLVTNLVLDNEKYVHVKHDHGKHGHNNEKYETCGIKYKYCECCLGYTNVDWRKFNEVPLPEKEDFHSHLNT